MLFSVYSEKRLIKHKRLRSGLSLLYSGFYLSLILPVMAFFAVYQIEPLKGLGQMESLFVAVQAENPVRKKLADALLQPSLIYVSIRLYLPILLSSLVHLYCCICICSVLRGMG